jgi:hypothetical protein
MFTNLSSDSLAISFISRISGNSSIQYPAGYSASQIRYRYPAGYRILKKAGYPVQFRVRAIENSSGIMFTQGFYSNCAVTYNRQRLHLQYIMVVNVRKNYSF